MRDMVTKASLNHFLSQQAQCPAVMAFRRITTGKRSDLGALCAIDDYRPTRTRRIVEAGQAGGVVAIPPGGDRRVGDLERTSNLAQGLAAVEFEQRSGAFELPGRERTVR